MRQNFIEVRQRVSGELLGVLRMEFMVDLGDRVDLPFIRFYTLSALVTADRAIASEPITEVRVEIERIQWRSQRKRIAVLIVDDEEEIVSVAGYQSLRRCIHDERQKR